MATIRRVIDVGAEPDAVWDALCDYGAVHERVVPGFVTGTVVDGSDRVVTFVTGAVARERLVSADDELRRLVYSVVESGLGPSHHQASVEVLAAGPGAGGSRLVWTSDVLPDELAPAIEKMMDLAVPAMVRTLAG